MRRKTYAVIVHGDRLLLIDYQERASLAWLDRTAAGFSGSANVTLPAIISERPS